MHQVKLVTLFLILQNINALIDVMGLYLKSYD